MKEIPLTKGKSAIVDDDMYDYLIQWKWFYLEDGRGHGYAARALPKNNAGKRSILFMHNAILLTPKRMCADHINRNTLDNQRSNLRVCTISQNNANRIPLQKNNTSGKKGVVWYKNTKKWKAQINFRGRKISIGYYDNIEDAFAAYLRKAQELFGEFSGAETYN